MEGSGKRFEKRWLVPLPVYVYQVCGNVCDGLWWILSRVVPSLYYPRARDFGNGSLTYLRAMS